MVRSLDRRARHRRTLGGYRHDSSPQSSQGIVGVHPGCRRPRCIPRYDRHGGRSADDDQRHQQRDSGPNTLRAALTAANTTADDVEIDVASGLGTVTLASGLPAYTGDGANHSLTVKGNGVSITGASGANVFDTISGYAGAETFDSLTITGGAVAINANGVSSITLTNSTLSGGSLDGIGTTGAVSVSNSSITGRGDDAITNGGGAITVSGSALTGNGNDAIDTGSSTITVTASTLAGNTHDGIDTGGASAFFARRPITLHPSYWLHGSPRRDQDTRITVRRPR